MRSSYVSTLIVHSHTTYHILHHHHPLPPDLVDHFRYVDRLFLLYLLQNMLDGDEGASTTNSSTEGRGRRSECHTLSQTLTLTCSGPPWGPSRTCALSSLSCGRLGWVWHSRAPHGQARPKSGSGSPLEDAQSCQRAAEDNHIGTLAFLLTKAQLNPKYLHSQITNGVVCQYLLLCNRDLKGTKVLGM